MTENWILFAAVAGFGLLAASLATQKKALWFAVAGTAVLTALAVGESDPLLFLGALASMAARMLPPPQKDSPTARVDDNGSPGPPP